MLDLIIKKLERKFTPQELRGKIGLLSGILGLISNVSLFIGKLTIGLLANSVSIVADAMNSFSDAISSIIVVFGFKIAAKPADKGHPYGHERFEYVSGLFVSLLITFVGVQFLKSSFLKILNPESLHFSNIILIILILSILIKVIQGLIYKKLSRKIQSQTLAANSLDSFSDVYTTSAVLIAIVIEYLTSWKIDGWMGLIVSFYILYNGIKMVIIFINELLGQRPTEKEVEKIESLLKGNKKILGYHDLLIHNYGPQKQFASVHIEVNSRMTLNQAHELVDEIEKDVQKKIAVHLVCHLDPVALDNIEYQKIYHEIKKILYLMNPDFRIHDFRLKKEKIIQFDLVMPESNQLSEDAIKEQIVHNLSQEDYQLEITFDYVYFL